MFNRILPGNRQPLRRGIYNAGVEVASVLGKRVLRAGAASVSAGVWKYYRNQQAEEEKKSPANSGPMRRNGSRSPRRINFRRPAPLKRRARFSRVARTAGRTSRRSLSRKRLYKKRSLTFRKFRGFRRRGMKRSRGPGWARGSLSKYLSRTCLVKDSGVFSMNMMGNAKQNYQQYYMAWAATAADLDEWLLNAFNKTLISNIPRYDEIWVKSIKKVITLSNNSNLPCEVSIFMVKPKRRYDGTTASITGINPSAISDTMPIETGTTTFGHDNHGHEPWMCSYLKECMTIKKVKSVRLEPGKHVKTGIIGKGGVFSKMRYGVAANDGFDSHHTVMKNLSSWGLIIQVRGVLVHDESKVAFPLQATDLHVAHSGFNVDGHWERLCRYQAPVAYLTGTTEAGVLYRGYDAAVVNTMDVAQESRWGESVADNKMDA